MLVQYNSRLPVSESSVTRFPAEKRSDATLAVDAAAGDRDAIAIIWDRYSSLVFGVLFGALGPDPAVEDLAQDVFLGFIHGAGRLRDGTALRGYLAGMAVKQAAQEIRRRKVRRWVGLTVSGELPEGAVPPLDAESREVLSALHRVLERLSSRRRMAFILRQVQALEVLEAAAALGISEATFRRELKFAKDFIARASVGEPALAELLTKYEGSW